MVTSGYVSCLPVLHFNEVEREALGNIAQLARDKKVDSAQAIEDIDKLVFQKIQLSDIVIENIIYFSKNLGKCV